MRVTTLIAHKDYFEYLPKAIRSALKQTYANSICVVDASEDKKAFFEAVKAGFDGPIDYSMKASKDGILYTVGPHNFLSINQENTFPSNLRNIGIDFTIGNTDLYMILDADDEMLPTKVQRFVETVEQSPDEIGAVYADHLTVNTVTGEENVQYREPYSALRLSQECIVHSNSGVTSLALKASKDQFGYFDNTMRTCEDYDLWCRISKKFMIVHLAEVLSLVRVQPKNSSMTVDKEIWARNWNRVHAKNHQSHS